MDNDLISRDALKKALKSNCKPELCHDYNSAWCEACCPHNEFEDLIDDAPTVPLPDFKEGYKQAIVDGKTNFSRPEGKWIYHRAQGDFLPYMECDNCHEEFLFLHNMLRPAEFRKVNRFCSNCGADMRGKKND